MQQLGRISKELCLVKEASLKRLHYDLIYMTFSKIQNYRDGEQVSSYQELLAKWP